MAFTRSPHRLTRTLTVRVEDDFPDRLAAASLKAGVPNGVLLARLVDQFLGDEKTMTAAQHYEALGRKLGYLPEAGTPAAVKRRRKSTAVMATEADEADIKDRYGKSTDELADEAVATILIPAEPFTWEPQEHTTPVMAPEAGSFWS